MDFNRSRLKTQIYELLDEINQYIWHTINAEDVMLTAKKLHNFCLSKKKFKEEKTI